MVTKKTVAEKAAAAPIKPSAKQSKKPPTRVIPGKDGEPAKLGMKLDLFVREYLVDMIASKAIRRVFPHLNPMSARSKAADMMKIPEVRAAIDAAIEARRKRVDADGDEVVRRLTAMATADERELMEMRVGCCRYCWGKDHRYQFTSAEMERAEAEHAARVEREEASGDFDTRGGPGFNANDDPNPECPECFGDGNVRPVFKDTRYLSPGAAMLFAGIKTTKDGMEIKTHSRADALIQLGRHFGVFDKDNKRTVELDATEELRQFLNERGGSRLPINPDPDGG